MPKMTLLQIVQDILNDMDSEVVNNIDDTEESEQVAQIAKTTYYELMASRNWPHLNTLLQFDNAYSSDNPTRVKLPDGIYHVHWVKYDKRTSNSNAREFQNVIYCEPLEFVEICNARDSTSSDVDEVTEPDSNTLLLIDNTRAPTYWTSFDDEYIYFDSYDSAIDSTILVSKTQAFVSKEPAWSVENSFTPDLPTKVFPLYLAEVKSTCFNALKQAANPKEEQRVRRQTNWLAQNKWRNNGGRKYTHYGRK